MLIRIVKQYNHLSPKNGIKETDHISFNSLTDAKKFIESVNNNSKIDYNVIDYEIALITLQKKEIIENPTGGYVGAIK